MCVIIARNPGIVIDPDKLRSACVVNPDGFGVSIVDRGKIETVYHFKAGGNDANELIRIFEDAKDNQIFAHLRYSTKGTKNQDNCHPFKIYGDDEFSVMFMHNGTLGEFGNATLSDSREFAEVILSPLTRAFREIDGHNIFNNVAYKKIVEKYRNGASVFTLYDSNGASMYLGTGHQHEGWWSSNTYSFDRTHREPSNSSVNYYGAYNTGHDKWDDHSWRDRWYENHNKWRLRDYFNSYKNEWGRFQDGVWDPNHDLNDIDPRAKSTRPKETGNSVIPFAVSSNEKTSSTSGTANVADKNKRATPEPSKEMKELMESCAAIGQAIHQAKKANLEPVQHTTPDKRTTFMNMADIDNLEEICMLDEEQLYEMAERWPMATTMLVMDLIFELYQKKQAERFHSYVKAQGEAKQAAQVADADKQKAAS